MNGPARLAPLDVVIEIARAQDAGDPFAFRFNEQAYSIRSDDGSYETAVFPWGSDVLDDMARIQRPRPDRAAMQRMGDRLRAFLEVGSQGARQGRIEAAIAEGRRVDIAVRSAAAELYALPWELVTRRPSGQHIGEIDEVCIHYEWPAIKAKARSPDPPVEGAPILFAWSAAGGAVPAAEHLGAIRDAARAGFYPFDEAKDVLAHASLRSLRDALGAGSGGRRPCVLHLLCHGAATASEPPSFGLVLDGSDEGDGPEIIDAGALRQALEPFASSLALVVLAACQGGDTGDLGNHLGSVAQALHRVGIPAVVASRYPLSVEGSITLARELYAELLVDLGSLEAAFLRARRSLVRRPERIDWAAVQLVAATSRGPELRPITARPYRGLLPFRPEDHRLFFGRSREVKRLLGALGQGRRFVSLIGPSGSGKSSLVMAGLVPALERGDPAAPDAQRRHPTVRVMRPGASPSAALAAALAPAMDAGAEVILVVDQFEEIFTQARDMADVKAFVGDLLSATEGPRGGATVILTLRADYLSNCLMFSAALSDRLRDTTTMVMPMNDDELREAIERPAAAFGLRFEEGLVDVIVGAAREDEGPRAGGGAGGGAARGANLALVEFALDALWERRDDGRITFEAYRAIGGLRGALARKAEVMLSERAGSAEIDIVRAIFGRLVSVGEGTADTRRYASRAELSAIAPGEVEPILERWIEARLLMADEGEVWIAQEALIHEWATLRAWISESREALRVRQEIGHDAGHWIEGGRADDDLLRGGRLRRAMELLEAKMLSVAKEERAFLDASEAREARIRDEASARELHERDQEMARQTLGRRRAALAAAGAFVFAAVTLGLCAWMMRENRASNAERDRAEHEASEARALLQASKALCPSATGSIAPPRPVGGP